MWFPVICRALFLTYVVAVVACGARSELDLPQSDSGECVSFSGSAQLAPLDVFVMMDASGSMLFPTANGLTKWEAVSAALTAFFEDPDSLGIGVELTFFPIIDDSVPELCSTSETCGAPDSCDLLRMCLPSQDPCNTDADCVTDETCEQIGYCEFGSDLSCLPSSQPLCPGNMGACLDLGYCENHYTCDVEAYQNPAVPLTSLPGALEALGGALGAQVLDGGTPTLPAVAGVLHNATIWAEANPERKVIALLATDGQPTVCDPELDPVDTRFGIQNIADVANDAFDRGVQTFVIGVFSPDEAADARANMDVIAAAGGSGAAYLIATSETLADQFLEALNGVRLSAAACEFVIAPDSDETIAYSDLVVRVTPAVGEPLYVSWVGSSEGCSAGFGFYYDRPLDGGEPPARIILCPDACALLVPAGERIVDIFEQCADAT